MNLPPPEMVDSDDDSDMEELLEHLDMEGMPNDPDVKKDKANLKKKRKRKKHHDLLQLVEAKKANAAAKKARPKVRAKGRANPKAKFKRKHFQKPKEASSALVSQIN